MLYTPMLYMPAAPEPQKHLHGLSEPPCRSFRGTLLIISRSGKRQYAVWEATVRTRKAAVRARTAPVRIEERTGRQHRVDIYALYSF